MIEGRSAYVVQHGQPDVAFLLTDSSALVRIGPSAALALMPVAHDRLVGTMYVPTAWRTLGELASSVVSAPGGVRQVQVISARNSTLARAQQAIVERLAAMDMLLCGPSVRYLLDWWRPELISRGYAVLGTDAGLRLASPVSSHRIDDGLLQSNARVVDYRVGVARDPG